MTQPIVNLGAANAALDTLTHIDLECHTPEQVENLSRTANDYHAYSLGYEDAAEYEAAKTAAHQGDQNQEN